MRRCIQLSVLPLMGLCWFCLAESRADEVQLNPPAAASEAPASQPTPQDAAEKEPAVPRFVLLLTRQVAVDNAPVVRTTSPDHFDDFKPTQSVPKRQFSSSRPIPKRSSKRPTKRSNKQETLRVLCADVKLSGSAAPGKAVSYTIECTGPVTLDNGTTKIHASKLQYTEGALTLDDVTIHQTGSTAGLFEEMQSEKLIIKFPLESLAIQDADKYVAPQPRDNHRREPGTFDDLDEFIDPEG